MRITNKYMTNSMVRNIQLNMSNLARSQEQLSTSKRLLRPSDDPNAMGQFLSIRSNLSYMEQYNQNINDGLSYLNMNDTAMGTLGDLLAKASEYTVQAANDTYSAEDRAAIAEQIDKMIDQAVDLGNSSVGDKYIYAGAKNATAPFKRVGDTIIYSGDTNEVRREVLAGTDYRIDSPGITTGVQVEAVNDQAKSSALPPVINSRQIDKSKTGILELTYDVPSGGVTLSEKELDGITDNPNLVTAYTFDPVGKVFEVTSGDLTGLEITFPGSNSGAQYSFTIDNRLGVFGNADISTNVVYDPTTAATKDAADKGIFDTLFALRDRLRSNDTAGIQTSIDELKQATDSLLQDRVQVGARTSHFEVLQSMLDDQEVKLTENLNNIEGADIAKLSIEYNQQLLSFQASLAAGAKNLQVSLLNFLS